MNNNKNENKSSQNTSKLVLIVFACIIFSVITPILVGIGNSTDALIAFAGMYYAIIIPAASFMILNDKVKIAFCLVNVVVSIFIAANGDPIMWLVVAWVFLWGFISLLHSAVKVWNVKLKEKAGRTPDTKAEKLGEKYVWIYYPFINLILELLCFFAIVGIFSLLPKILGDSDGWGVIFMFIPVLIFFCLVIVPVISCRYVKKIKNLGKLKYLCCIYNSVIMSSWVIIMMIPNLQNAFTSIYFHGLFWPSLIAGLIAAACSNEKTKSSEIEETAEATVNETVEVTEEIDPETNK